jgi:hypothetical protein
MEGKFNSQFEAFSNNKKLMSIPSDLKYNEMISILQKPNDENGKKISMNERNILRRFSLRFEQTVPVVYHSSESENENPQKVVKLSELFKILNDSHYKLGHGGIDLMWRDLRNYYAISKLVLLGLIIQYFLYFLEMLLEYSESFVKNASSSEGHQKKE